MRVTLIHNPNAGEDDQLATDDLIGLIRGAGHDVVYQSSKADDWKKVLNEACDIVAAAGGDGLVEKVAKRMIGRQTPIAILPLGTANNMAKTIGLQDLSIEALIAGWNTPRVMTIDVGVAHGPWGATCFLEGLGVGLFTDTMSELDATQNHDLDHANGNRETLTSTLDILIKRLQSSAPTALNITLDGHDLSDAYMLLEVMNIRSVGPNLVLAPDANLNDGRLDVVLVPGQERDKLHRYLSACKAGREGAPGLTVRQSRHVRMVWEGWTLHIDDDVWPDGAVPLLTTPLVIDVRVHPEPLRFLTST